MKMPRRSWYPPVKLEPDIFGLHHMTLIHLACESEAERAKRVARIEKGVVAAFTAARHHLGEDQARALFAKVLRRSKRGRGRALAPDRDIRLLRAYDTASKGESIAAVARRLRAEGTELGNTATAIETQLRKLLADRKKRDYRIRVEARRLRMAMRNEPPTLLAMAVAEARQREK